MQVGRGGGKAMRCAGVRAAGQVGAQRSVVCRARDGFFACRPAIASCSSWLPRVSAGRPLHRMAFQRVAEEESVCGKRPR